MSHEWILDSGCSKHMTGNRELFTSYKEYDGGHVVFGSNLRGKVVGKGNILHDNIKFLNVEHVSGLAYNLISIGQLCDKDLNVKFSKHESLICKDDKVLVKDVWRNGLYTCRLGDNPNTQVCLASIIDNSTLWHRRLGHANMRLLQKLTSNELVRDLPNVKFDNHFCDACKIGKQVHSSHKSKNAITTKRCLELLHMDLFGPSSIQSYGGNFYTLVVVDDFSRYTWTLF